MQVPKVPKGKINAKGVQDILADEFGVYLHQAKLSLATIADPASWGATPKPNLRTGWFYDPAKVREKAKQLKVAFENKKMGKDKRRIYRVSFRTHSGHRATLSLFGDGTSQCKRMLNTESKYSYRSLDAGEVELLKQLALSVERQIT